jgi:hypothetical protein
MKPYSLQKAPIESISLIQSMMNRFNAVCNSIFHKEIGEFNKEEADKLK